jgi:hypothetical protein
MDVLRKYSCLKHFKGIHEIIDSFESISKVNKLFLGISGSALSMRYKKGMDIDLVLIIPDKFFLSDIGFLPKTLQLNYWQKGIDNRSSTSIDVIGSYCSINPAIRVEIYKESSAIKILNRNIFTIYRLKDVPKNNKIELFITFSGNTIDKRLDKISEISTTVSFIKVQNDLYWGMHFERLFLSDKFIDSLCFNEMITSSREFFFGKIKGNSEIKDLFYISRYNNKINIYRYLVSQLQYDS